MIKLSKDYLEAVSQHANCQTCKTWGGIVSEYDTLFMLEYVKRERWLHENSPGAELIPRAVLDALEALANIQRIVDIYFQPWGAAKGAMWEEISGDGPFNAETALRIIQKAQEEALRKFRASLEGK